VIKKKYDLQNAFVIGHVGRFHYAKNHVFLLEVFQEIRKKKSNAKLLLVGDGDMMPAVKEKTEQLGLSEHVIFTGMQKDTAGYYRAMDLVVFPSHYEGLPGTVVEAQAAGLPVLMSDTVTDQVAVTPLVECFSLQKSAAEWAEEALALYDRLQEKLGTEMFRKECYDTLCEKGFDVTAQARQLEQIYAQML
jgi:glycosyltransferase involved in cell wall biosynthesis